MVKVQPHLRNKVLKRDEYRCQNCGYDYLDIHYIDGNIENKDLGNLTVLCRQCHYRCHQIDKLKKIEPILNDFLNKFFEEQIEIFVDIGLKEILENFKDEIREEMICKLVSSIKRIISNKLTENIIQEIEEEIEKERKNTVESLRKIVLERNNYMCSGCGYGYLEVHHIDWNRTNNNLDNLITLCRKCHREIHFSIHPLTKPNDADKCTQSLYNRLCNTISKILKNKKTNIKININFIQLGVKKVKIDRTKFEKLSKFFGHEVIEDIFNQWEKEITNYLIRLEWEQRKERYKSYSEYRNVYILLKLILSKDSFESFVNLANSRQFHGKTLEKAKKILKEGLK